MALFNWAPVGGAVVDVHAPVRQPPEDGIPLENRYVPLAVLIVDLGPNLDAFGRRIDRLPSFRTVARLKSA